MVERQAPASVAIRFDAGIEVEAFLANMETWRLTENAASCRAIEAVLDVFDTRMEAECALYAAGLAADMDLARKTASCDVAAASGSTKAAAGRMFMTAEQLDLRLPLTAIRFRYGVIDLARVRAIAAVLAKAGDATVAAIEWQAVSAAERLMPEPLTARIWALWEGVDPKEAEKARAESARRVSGVKVRGNPDGTSTLTAYLSTLQGAEADSLITEMAGTVCDDDPRSKKLLRSAALMAFLRQEAWVQCLCESATCPYIGRIRPTRDNHEYLATVLIDIETLLGLTASPARLANGTPLDAELARTIASDARWQGLLTEMVTVAGEQGFEVPEHEHEAASELQVRRHLRRGRVRPPGIVPTPAQPPETNGGVDAATTAAVAKLVADYLAAIERDPALARGLHPDGHGGYATPPPGALKYRPSQQLQAMVRATYPTCTHQGCNVPSSRCELDHCVPFDRNNPSAGGWTIAENLHPLCTVHHQVKTARMWIPGILAAGIVCWRSNSGLTRITVPTGIVLTSSDLRPKYQPPPATAPLDPLDTEAERWWENPTWWERHQPDGTVAMTLSEISFITDHDERQHALQLRARYREHDEALWARYMAVPCPF